MKVRSKTILAAVFLCSSVLASTGLAGPPAPSCSLNIPAGTIIRIYPDEHIVAGTTSGPLLFTVAADVRFFLNRAPVIPRGSKVLGRMEASHHAGRLWGRAKAEIVFTSLLTPDWCEYAIDATLTSANKYAVRDEVITGRGHARRDVFAMLFPPTTLYQLIRLPARGPALTIDQEHQLVIKLLQPVYGARLDTTAPAASAVTTDASRGPEECAKMSGGRMIFPARTGTLRPFQNTTPHDIVIYGNGFPVGTIQPCSESVLMLPRGALKLKAVATIRQDDGQREIEAPLSLNDKGTGWQVLPIREQSSSLR